MYGKIALEEHYESPDWDATGDPQNETARNKEEYFEAVKARLHSADLRIRDMDRNGVEMFIMSLTQPGIQEVLDTNEAVKIAHEMNLWVYENYVNYTMKGVKNHVEYLDEPQNFCFWRKLAELDVPLYLHPRDPAPSQQRTYEGYPGLLGSAWGFGAETALHAIRILCSGIFDELPTVKLILGHLGEGLPFGIPRLQHRLNNQKQCGAHQKPLTDYFENNVWITTSGHFHTRAFWDTLLECDNNKVMFSSDTPYESLDEAATWFDNVPLSYKDRIKIGRQNAIIFNDKEIPCQ
ncbi:MAG TPA: amidohydrolase family protein [Negativicutes bacterium]